MVCCMCVVLESSDAITVVFEHFYVTPSKLGDGSFYLESEVLSDSMISPSFPALQ